MSYRRATGLLLAGCVISLVGSGVARAEKEIFGLKASGDIEVGGRVYADRPPDEARAKFEEYRDLSQSPFLDFLRLRGDSKDDFYTIELRAINGGLDDQNFQLRSYGIGRFDFLFEWDQIPHNISRNSQTLFVEGPEGTFTLLSPSPALLDWNVAPRIDEIGFRTDTALVQASYTPAPNWDIGVDFRRIYKHGDRLLGLPFGTPGSNAAEVAAPIVDTIYEVDASAAFGGDGYQLQFNYIFSLYDNDLDSGFRVDNPCSAGPGLGNPACTAGNQTGPAQGQGALAPDNYAHTFTLAGGVNLPMQTRLNSSFSYSMRKQNQAFLPFTINPVLAADPAIVAAQAALPNDLDGEVNTLRFNLSATSRPMDDLTATAKFRVYRHDDSSSTIPFTAYVEDDRLIVSGDALPLRARLARRYPYTRINAGGDVRYQVLEPVAVTVGFDCEYWNRKADLFDVPAALIEEGGNFVVHVPREVNTTNEYTPKVMLDLTPFDWLLFRVSYAHSIKNGSNYLQASEEQFALLRKYDMADRDRDRVEVLADLIPIDNLVLTATFNYTSDDYRNSRFGLQDGKSWAAGADASWKPLDWLRVFAGYVHEEWDNNSRLKFRTPSPTVDQLDNPTFDWISEVEDRYDTVRVGFDADLIPKKLHGGVSWNYSIGHTDMNAFNPVTPVGTAGNVASATASDFPGIRNSLSMLNVFLRYWISEHFSARVNYAFERFTQSDFRSDGLQPFNAVTGDTIFLGNNLLVMFVNDHLQNFPYSNMPAFCVGLAGAHDAPGAGSAALMRIPPRKVPGAPDWALGLLETGLAAGFDLAYSYEIESWDELSVPLHFLTPEGELPVVPVYTNCGAPPLPVPRRCHALGGFVRSFVQDRPAGERVALLATGGISHWVGTPETGRINAEFDQWVLDQVARGDVEPLLRLTWADIERDGGNGGQEIRNWLALLGAVPGAKGEVLAYEGVPEWITGCATVWVQP